MAEGPVTGHRLVVVGPGRAELAPFSLPPVPDGGALVETIATGLSAGTELTWFKGTNPYLTDAWDPELGLFAPADGPGGASPRRPWAAYPIERMGYMEVARVVLSRTPALVPGTTVAMAFGHATHHVADPVAEHVVALPDDLDPLLGVYVAHMGPICANGVLHAASAVGEVADIAGGVRGRHVLVTGAGVVGLLTALFAADLGAAAVVVADPDPARRAAAEGLGLEAVDDTAVDVAALVKTRWRHGPADHGADVAFQCRGRPESLALALRALRPQAAVIDLAFYQSGAEPVRLGEEFHHNGLALVCAQIGRVPSACRPLWDRRRLSLETIALLRRRGADVRRHLVSDVVPLDEAPALFESLAARRRSVLQAVFTTAGTGI